MSWTAWLWYSSYLSPSLYPWVAVGCSLHYKGRRKCSYPPLWRHLVLLIHRMMEKKTLLQFVNSIFLRLCVHLAVCHSAFLSRFLHPVFVTDEWFYFTQGSNKILSDKRTNWTRVSLLKNPTPRTRLAPKKAIVWIDTSQFIFFPLSRAFLPPNIRELKQRRFWATHVNRKWTFYILWQWFCPNFRANPRYSCRYIGEET